QQQQQQPPPSRPLRPAGSPPCPVPPCRTGRRGARRRAAAISPGTGSGGASVQEEEEEEEEEEGAAAIMAGLSRTLGIFGGFVAVVGAALYPIYFRPLLLPDEYSECRGAAGSRGEPRPHRSHCAATRGSCRLPGEAAGGGF
ncbi:SIM20 protein, partial [Asarcornis scutulata]|nr:SIM20 protein [Asarcornis scutulata]